MEHSQGIINECWRSVDGFINYQISNTGRVRNASSGKILADKCCDTSGYPQVRLFNNVGGKTCRIHKLVAEHFLTKPATDTKFEVDHIDRNKTNNVVTNLMWKTRRQNEWNKGKTNRPTSSKYIGVSFVKRHHKWRATIIQEDGWKHLGYFQHEKDAARAYNARAYELRGSFAVLNDISDDED